MVSVSIFAHNYETMMIRWEKSEFAEAEESMVLELLNFCSVCGEQNDLKTIGFYCAEENWPTKPPHIPLQNRKFQNLKVRFRAFGSLKCIRSGPERSANSTSGLLTLRKQS